MQPLDPDKKPAVHATPLNHVGLWIDDLPKAVDWLEAQGLRFAPGGIRRGAAGFDICFVHPKGNEEFPVSGEGVLIELVQAPPEVVKAFAALAMDLSRFPRRRYTPFATPLEFLPNFTRRWPPAAPAARARASGSSATTCSACSRAATRRASSNSWWPTRWPRAPTRWSPAARRSPTTAASRWPRP
jgi:hypothetical protein